MSDFRDELIYGGVYTYWGLVAFFTVDYCYDSVIQLSISLYLMSSLFSILGIAVQSDKLKIESIINVNTIMNDQRYIKLALCDFSKLVMAFLSLRQTDSIAIWFMMTQADSMLISTYRLLAKGSKNNELELSQGKFISLTLYVIVLFLSLIFKQNILEMVQY
mmetsp:Transcript_10080/g.10017  ORF Transcript_10080/g.10017 Transcript_10080/m.10017 type:complete len:162 (+) Transcript_10080:4-489(+)